VGPDCGGDSVRYEEFPQQSPRQTPGILVRESARWYRFWETKVFAIPVPYISNVGKFTIHRLGVWRTTPETWYASVVATVFNRMLNLYSRRSGREFIDGSARTLIFRAASLYTFTHSNYAMDRLLANLWPKRLSVFRRLIHQFSCKLGANFGFVYGQSKLQLLWLTYRSKWTRDKPSIVIDMIQNSMLVYPTRRCGKYRFFEINPFIKTLNWLRLNV